MKGRRRVKERIFKLLLMLLIAIGIVGCNNIEEEPKEPILYLVSDNYIMYIGDEKEIIYYVDNLYDFEIKFESSDEEVFIIVDEKIKAIGTGTATLKVSIVGYEDIFEEASVRIVEEGSGVTETHNIILNWAKESIGTDLFEAKLFPTKHNTYQDAKITYKSSKPEVLSDRGLLFPEDYDIDVTVTITVDYNGVEKSIDHKVTVVGKIPSTIATEFFAQFYSTINGNVNINYLKDKYPDAKITFRSGNEKVLSNKGVFTKPEKDAFFSIYATIEIPSIGYSREFSKAIKGLGLSVSEKAQIVKEDIINKLGIEDGLIDSDLNLPLSEERYDGTISWISNYPEIIGSDGKLYRPLLNTMIELKGSIQFDNGVSTFILKLEVVGRDPSNNKWADIEEFLNIYIFKEEIKTLKYSVMGVDPSYTAYNDGYVLFYQNSDIEVIEDILPASHNGRPRTLREVKYVTIHDTANNREGADAEMHNTYLKNSTSTTSWHYTIDDNKLYHHIPNNEIAWHAGDGGSGPGNRNSIGIETCTNLGVDYDLVMRRTAKLVAQLLDEHNLSVKSVKQHYDWTGKNCPQVIRGSNRWGELIELISLEFYGRQNLKGVEFEWKSLSPTILDDTGKVFNHPGPATQVSFEVKVTYNNETRTYTHTANLQAKK